MDTELQNRADCEQSIETATAVASKKKEKEEEEEEEEEKKKKKMMIFCHQMHLPPNLT